MGNKFTRRNICRGRNRGNFLIMGKNVLSLDVDLSCLHVRKILGCRVLIKGYASGEAVTIWHRRWQRAESREQRAEGKG
jgi:hypothetical protein